jgi:hypothetical protein
MKPRRMSLLAAVGFVILGVCSTPKLFGQTSTGAVRGEITDQSGAAVPGAEVVLQSTTTGVKRTTESLQAGNYELPLVPPDTYQLTVKRTGFSTVTINNVIVRVNETYTQNVQMQIGAVTQEVSVTAQVAKVDAVTPSLGGRYGVYPDYDPADSWPKFFSPGDTFVRYGFQLSGAMGRLLLVPSVGHRRQCLGFTGLLYYGPYRWSANQES